VLFLAGDLHAEAATRLAAELMTLDATGTDPITLYVDSSAGALEPAFVVTDTMAVVRPPVRAHCLARAGGPAVALVALADQRSAAPHARFHLVQPEVQLAGTADQLTTDSAHLQDLLRRFQLQLADATGQPLEELVLDLRRGRYLDAQEALSYGLIDTIGAPEP
jgi:ATP-dependent Clp protease protease subunit